MSGRNISLFLFLFLLGCLALFLILLTPGVDAAIEGDQPPQQGDWLVLQDTNVTGETIYLTSNLSVTNGSILRFQDSTLQFNTSGPETFSFRIFDGSILYFDLSLLEANGTGLLIDPGAQAFISNSTLNDMEGELAGLVFRGDQLNLEESNVSASEVALALFQEAEITDTNFSNNEVAVELFGTLDAVALWQNNTFHQNQEVDVRYHSLENLQVVDVDGHGVPQARVWVNDTFSQTWLTDRTDEDGEVNPFWIPIYEILPAGGNRSLEPYSLEAMRNGVDNLTNATPSTQDDLLIRLEMNPELRVLSNSIHWSNWPEEELLVPTGSDNATLWKWQVYQTAEELPDKWYTPQFDDSQWEPAPAPFGDSSLGSIENNTQWQGNNLALFRHSFSVPEDRIVSGGLLSIASNNYGSYYLGGKLLFSDWRQGGGHGADYFNHEIPVNASLLPPGETVQLACLVEETGFTQWFDAELILYYFDNGTPPLAVNHTAYLSLTIENEGKNDARDVLVSLYNESGLIATNILGVKAGSKVPASFQWMPEMNETFNLTVRVDEPDAFTESNESDNEATLPMVIGRYEIEYTVHQRVSSILFTENTTLQFSVRNTGEVFDNFSFRFAMYPEDWSVDFDHWYAALEPGENLTVNLSVTPALHYEPIPRAVTMWAESQYYRGLGIDDHAAKFQDFQVEVLPTHYLIMPEMELEEVQLINTTVNYTIIIDNTGHFNESMDIDIGVVGDPAWGVLNDRTNLTLIAKETGQFEFQIHANDSLQPGAELNLTLNFTQSAFPFFNFTYYLNLTAQHPYRLLTLDKYGEDLFQLNGTSVIYNLTLKNSGNTPLTLDLELNEVFSNGSWSLQYGYSPITLQPDQEASYTFTIEAGENLRPGQVQQISLTFTPRENTSLARTYHLNLTGQVPPDIWSSRTKVSKLPEWIATSNVELEWDVIREDYNDTTRIHLFYQTVDLKGNRSNWIPIGVFDRSNGSTVMTVEDGLTYLVYSLGEDSSGNLEADKRPAYDTWFRVDLSPPDSVLEVAQLPHGSTTGYTNQALLELSWGSANQTTTQEIDTYTVEYRVKNPGGTMAPWTIIAWLNNTQATSGQFTLPGEGLYQFRVKATNHAGLVEDKPGWEAQLILDNTAPSTSLVPLVPIQDTNRIELVFDLTGQTDLATLIIEYTNYKIGHEPTSYDWRELTRFEQGNLPTSYEHVGLADGYRYFYRVRGIDGIGNIEIREDRVELFEGNGETDQRLQLSRIPLPALTLNDPTLKVEVDAQGDGTFESQLETQSIWPLVGGGLVHLDLLNGELRFGDGVAGYMPSNGSVIRVTYQAYDTEVHIDKTSPFPASKFREHKLDEGKGTVSMVWEASSSSDVIFYRLEVSETGTDPWSLVGNFLPPAPTVQRITGNFTDLQTGHTYFFRVLAVDLAGHLSSPNSPYLFIDLSEEAPVADDDDDSDGDGTDGGLLLVLLLFLGASLVALFFIVRQRQSSSGVQPWGKPREPTQKSKPSSPALEPVPKEPAEVPDTEDPEPEGQLEEDTMEQEPPQTGDLEEEPETEVTEHEEDIPKEVSNDEPKEGQPEPDASEDEPGRDPIDKPLGVPEDNLEASPPEISDVEPDDESVEGSGETSAEAPDKAMENGEVELSDDGAEEISNDDPDTATEAALEIDDKVDNEKDNA